MKKYLVTSASALAAALLAPQLGAQTFNWGNTINPEGIPGFVEMSYDSNGVAIDMTGETFTFELGVFSGGFDPDPANTDIWGLNWQPIDATSYSPTLNYFTSSYSMVADDASFEGLRAYIWIYNNTIGDETSEWFLATGDTGGTSTSNSNWIVPEYVGGGGGNPPGTYDWRLSTANSPVWGGLNSVAGDGVQNVDPVLYEMQAFGVPVPVPEPSGIVLISLGAVLVLRRRR